jgi:putative OmpL-like beta-barrel porin-2
MGHAARPIVKGAEMRHVKGAIVLAALLAVAGAAAGQTPTETKPDEKPKTLLEEIVLFGYVEQSYVGNLGQTSTAGSSGGLTYARKVNALRLYDSDAGYTFNLAELSVKKDPSDTYPFGFGLVITGGEDTQKNHSLGIFKANTTEKPRTTDQVDLQEAYLAYKVPLGSGLTLKAGKFVTLLGYEVIESPNNLTFSRSLLFAFAVPFTHTGGLVSYTFTDWLTVTAGVVEGWEVSDDNNGSASYTGQVAFTPVKDFTTNLNWIVGPEQDGNDTHQRWVADLTATYVGVKHTTLGLNVDVGGEQKVPGRVTTRQDGTASWWGWAGYAAYDWTERLRTAVRLEYFDDPESARTAGRPLGNRTSLSEVTATVQYKIWRGLVGRAEYRHDDANAKVFGVLSSGPTRTAQDTISLDFYYLFF